MSLADRIKHVLEKTAMSKAALARAAGVTDASVTFWLDGRTQSLKGSVAARLEQKTGFSAVWLLTGKGQKLTAPSEQGDMLLPKEVELIMALRELSDEEQRSHIEAITKAANRSREVVARALAAHGITQDGTKPPKATKPQPKG